MWFDAAQNITEGGGAVADGGTLDTWGNKIAGEDDWSQTVLANRPIWKTSIMNGNPVVRFDGATEWMTMPDGTTTPNEDLSWFWVYRPNGAGAHMDLISKNTAADANGNTRTWEIANDPSFSGGRVSYYRGGSERQANQQVQATDHYLFVEDGPNPPGGNTVIYFGNTLKTTSANGLAPTAYPDDAYLGRRQQAASPRYYNGDIAEFGLWERVLSAGERTGLYSYITAKYGALT
jgi:hypothetical protein